MSPIDTYKHLDKTTPLTLALPMEQLARDVVQLNYGAHRLLSAMVHALREKNAERAAEWERLHPGEAYGPSELADGIEALLNQGLVN